MVQTERNQQAVEERIDARTHSTEFDHRYTEHDQSSIDEGPDEEEDSRYHHGNHRSHNGDGALAGEEGKCIGKFGVLKLIVAGRADEAGQNADELVADFIEGGIGIGLRHHRNRAGSQEGGNHQPGDKAGKACSAVFIVRHTDGNADGKEPGHVVN